MPTPFETPAKRLRRLISQPGVCVQAPGVYDGICARLALEQGFQVMYQSGSMTTAARLGRADLAFASLNDFAQNAQMMASIDPRVPLIADADTGFGSPPNIARMVQVYHQSGIAGFHIEDQVANKRCGHLEGKEVVEMETWKSRIRACVLGRESIYGGSDIVIIARTDSLVLEGFDAAIQRLLAARDCGADMAFLEAIGSEEQIKKAVELLAPMPVRQTDGQTPTPMTVADQLKLMVNCVSRGKTPWYPPERLGEWGVKLAIYPGAAGKSVLHTIRRAYKYLKETGMDDAEAMGLDPRGFFEVMGIQEEFEIDRLARGDV